MIRKLNHNFKYLKLVAWSIRVNGILETLKKIQVHLKNKRNNEVYDLMALKPVDNKWKATKKLKHKYNISVVIPTYNRANMLKDLLDSWRKVAEVTKYSYEIIFSDDGSSDETINILRSATDLPIKILANEHGGAAKARNAAVMAAEGEKILIIGDDIFPNKYLLNQHYEKLNELDITDTVLGECVWHPDLKINHLMVHITEIGIEQFSFNVFQKHNYTDFRHFYTCNISIDREFLLSENIIFDESFYKVNFEDIELGYRLAKKGMKIYYYPEAKGQHFHPYNDINKFCLRQETAGEMAIVFNQLHKEVEVILKIEFIASKWSKYTQHNDKPINKIDIYQELIDFCQFIEDKNSTRNSNLSKDLSIIYTPLFRFAYEKGVFQTKHNTQSRLINDVFRNEFIDTELINAIVSLNKKCKVPNFEKIHQFATHSYAEKTILTIAVEDKEQLKECSRYYTELKNYLHYALESEVANEGFVYKPKKGFFLSQNSLKGILLFLQKYKEIDVVLLSFGILDLPKIGLSTHIENNVISRGDHIENHLIKLQNNTKAKVVRLFDMANHSEIEISALVNDRIRYLDDYGFFSKTKNEFRNIQTDLISFDLEEKFTKPIIFVLPIFLAVGGVEMNTIEIIKKLSSEYDFVVINFERLNQKLGSLHHQFLTSCKGIYDLTELSTHNDILSYLKILKEIYQPELVWICNGSPWLEKNILSIRDVFITNAIIDQQVYDEKEGWIKIYDEAGIHQFDKFIAVNSKIKNVFINEKGVPESKIHLIYSAVKNVAPIDVFSDKKKAYLEKYNITQDIKTFVFVGRMTEQKNPILFLNFIKKLSSGKKYNFILVGDGELSEEVDSYISHHNLTNVLHIKYIENLSEIYSVIDGLIIFSKFEGLPIAMLEALCMAVPVLSSDVGDIALVLEKYGAGVTFDHNLGLDEISDIFYEWVKDLSDYKLNLLTTHIDVRNDFSVKNISQEYKSLWKKAIEEKKAHAS